MPANMLARFAAIDQIQRNNQTDGDITAALQQAGGTPVAGNIPQGELTTPERVTGSMPQGDLPTPQRVTAEMSQGDLQAPKPQAISSSFNQLQFGNFPEAAVQPMAQAEAINNYTPINKPVRVPTADKVPPADAPLQGDQSVVGYLDNQAVQQLPGSEGTYSENLPNSIGNAIDRTFNLSSQVQNLGQMNPAQRASIGATLGAGFGASVGGGPVGAIVGSEMGAIAARSMGMIQSGEQDLNMRRQSIASTLGTMGAINQDGTSPFGGRFRFNFDPAFRLDNIAGGETRTIYDIDRSNPFSNRTTAVARPIARYLAEGLANQPDDGKGNAIKAIDNTTGMIVNMLTDGATDINSIYTRAKEFANKLGMSEAGARAFFSRIRGRIDPQEAIEIKKGLDKLYA